MKKFNMIVCSTLLLINAAVYSGSVYAETTSGPCHSFAWNQAAAQKGDADAQYQLAMMYFNGDDVKTDHQKAQQWLEQAAAQNNVQAQYRWSVNLNYSL